MSDEPQTGFPPPEPGTTAPQFPPPPPPGETVTKPKRRFYQRKLFWVAAVVVVLGVIGALVSSAPSTSDVHDFVMKLNAKDLGAAYIKAHPTAALEVTDAKCSKVAGTPNFSCASHITLSDERGVGHFAVTFAANKHGDNWLVSETGTPVQVDANGRPITNP